jgi:1-acyl-sn-glycerol-3-phosphate acyltransferase
MRAWHQVSLDGIENLPPGGPALLLTNHASFLDVPAVMSALPFEDLTLLASTRQLRKPVLGRILRAWDVIPVERNGRDLQAIRAILRALEEGKVVGIAVEGRISTSGRLGPVHPALAKLVIRAEVPAVPIAICGSWDALPLGSLVPRPRPVVVRVGAPFTLPPAIELEAATACIAESIARLLPVHQRPLTEEAEISGAGRFTSKMRSHG